MLTDRSDWITLGLCILCYAAFGAILWYGGPAWLVMPVLAILIAFQSSLQHEFIHGHPFKMQWMNTVVALPSLNLAIPYIRFRDTHLAHHINANLTDPYDDPESNFLSPAGWNRLCVVRQMFMRVNATLLGRMILGPVISQVYFLIGEWRLVRGGDWSVLWVWTIHCLVCGVLILAVSQSAVAIWVYLVAAYVGLGLLKIRTFAEHQAHLKVGPRTVVIEDRGPLALLFLNNNFHAVHHMHPKVPWYALPGLYFSRKDRFLRRNAGYVFSGYGALFGKYFIKPKDPVVHPYWSQHRK